MSLLSCSDLLGFLNPSCQQWGNSALLEVSWTGLPSNLWICSAGDHCILSAQIPSWLHLLRPWAQSRAPVKQIRWEFKASQRKLGGRGSQEKGEAWAPNTVKQEPERERYSLWSAWHICLRKLNALTRCWNARAEVCGSLIISHSLETCDTSQSQNSNYLLLPMKEKIEKDHNSREAAVFEYFLVLYKDPFYWQY